MVIRPCKPHLFCFGLGYSAGASAALLACEGWRVSGTCRDRERTDRLRALGYTVHHFDRQHPLPDAASALESVTDVLTSVPPDAAGDPVLDQHAEALLAARQLRWVGYLSTTGVYGDTDGEIVDETSPLRPTSERSRRRVEAERRWLNLHRVLGLPVHVFRLAGIYGPGRSTLDSVRDGDARRILKPGHRFSRIHVDDIAAIVRASMARPNPGSVYNVCDDLPAEQSEVVAFACDLLGVEPPALIPYEDAMRQLSPMARSFWQDNRRVANARMKRELGVRLQYPDYRAGLSALLTNEGVR
jgi:Nucleoside-diphosphate-sugar epimerases